MDKQAPICENYESNTLALVLWPSGKVQKFDTIAKAKTMLMRQHYHYIVCNIVEVSHYILDNEAEWYEKWKYMEGDLWQYLIDIAETRDPWAKAADIPESNRMSKAKTAAGYTISSKKSAEAAEAKLPKQAKVIASLFADYEDGSVITDDDVEKLLRNAAIKGVLKTKQPPMRIFTYYRSELLKQGCIALRS